MEAVAFIAIRTLFSTFMVLFIIQPAIADVIVNTTVTQNTNPSPATTSAHTTNSATFTKTIVIALVVVGFILFCVFFLMVNLCKKPFGNRLKLHTPRILLGTTQPFDNLTSTVELGHRALVMPARAAQTPGRSRVGVNV